MIHRRESKTDAVELTLTWPHCKWQTLCGATEAATGSRAFLWMSLSASAALRADPSSRGQCPPIACMHDAHVGG